MDPLQQNLSLRQDQFKVPNVPYIREERDEYCFYCHHRIELSDEEVCYCPYCGKSLSYKTP